MKTLLLILTLGGLSIIPVNFKNTEERNVGTYDGIHIEGSYEVILVSGSEGTIKLKGDSDDLEKIDTDVKKGTLIIKQKEKYWFGNWDSGTVYITIPVKDINKVILSGSGEIIADFPLEEDNFETILSGSGKININLDVTAVRVIVSGSGDINLTGRSSQVNFTVSGSGEIDAVDIKAKIGEARISGSGNISMYATEILNASIIGSGDVFCKGNPSKQITKVTGSGDITVRD